jgi:hypothetical protein
MARMAEGDNWRDSQCGVKQIKTTSAELPRAGKGTIVPMATAAEEAEDFQISSITMYGRGAETTRPCATTAALVIAERASSEWKSCSVIQATTVLMTATKQVRNHFTDKHLTIIRLHLAVYFLPFAGESD